jgi:hypothetical protein
MMNSRQQVKTSAELSNELFGNISTQLSKTIGQTVREIVQ